VCCAPAIVLLKNKTMDNQLEKNKALVRRFNMEFLQDGNAQVAEELIHPQFINHTVPPGAAGGDKAGSLAFIELMRQGLPDLKVKILMQVAEDDLVTTHKEFSGTHLGTMMGVAPTGRTVSFRVIDILRFKDGQAIEHWSVRDSMSLYQQLTA